MISMYTNGLPDGQMRASTALIGITAQVDEPDRREQSSGLVILTRGRCLMAEGDIPCNYHHIYNTRCTCYHAG